MQPAANHAAPRPASSSEASCTPIMNRRKKISPLPGITSTSDPNVVRPNANSRHTASATSRARASASEENASHANPNPSAANTVTTGSRPWSSSCPERSQASTCRAP